MRGMGINLPAPGETGISIAKPITIIVNDSGPINYIWSWVLPECRSDYPECRLTPQEQAEYFDTILNQKKQDPTLPFVFFTREEHLMQRARRRIAEDETNTLLDLIQIGWVPKGESFETLQILKINEFGVIEDYPDQLFSHSVDESTAILRASMNKKNKREGVLRHDND